MLAWLVWLAGGWLAESFPPSHKPPPCSGCCPVPHCCILQAAEAERTRKLTEAYTRGEPHALYTVDHVRTNNWAHARSLLDFLTVPDSDGACRAASGRP